MNVERIIDWLGRLTAGDLPPDTRTERVLSTERVIRAAKLLQRDEFELVRMHDVEGYSVEALQDETGLPGDTICRQVSEIRKKFRERLESRRKSRAKPANEEIVL